MHRSSEEGREGDRGWGNAISTSGRGGGLTPWMRFTDFVRFCRTSINVISAIRI